MSLAPFDRTPAPVAKKMLELARLEPGETLLDIGCGDGAILAEAARRGARAIGVDRSAQLVRLARARLRRLKLAQAVELVAGDFRCVRPARADVITLYLTTRGNSEVFQYLKERIRKDCRLVSHDFEIEGARLIQEEEFEYTPFDKRRILLYAAST